LLNRLAQVSRNYLKQILAQHASDPQSYPFKPVLTRPMFLRKRKWDHVPFFCVKSVNECSGCARAAAFQVDFTQKKRDMVPFPFSQETSPRQNWLEG